MTIENVFTTLVYIFLLLILLSPGIIPPLVFLITHKHNQKKWPEFFILANEVERQDAIWINYRNSTLFPIRKKLDKLFEQKKYFLSDNCPIDKEIKKLQDDYLVAVATEEYLHNKLKEARANIRTYVEKNNLEWA